MATNIKIVLSNSYGDERSITVPNSKNSITTLEQVRTAMANLLNGEYIMNRTMTNIMTAVKSAQKITTSSENLG